MSAVLRLPYYKGSPNNIFLIYDFKQFKDLILMVMYVDKLSTWKKIFIEYKDGRWKTHTLTRYLDTKTYKLVRNKLQLIYPGDTTTNEEMLDLENTMQQEAAFMLNMHC
jgi:hypothetical protein